MRESPKYFKYLEPQVFIPNGILIMKQRWPFQNGWAEGDVTRYVREWAHVAIHTLAPQVG